MTFIDSQKDNKEQNFSDIVFWKTFPGVLARGTTHGQTWFLAFHIGDLPPNTNGKSIKLNYSLWIRAFYTRGSCTEYPTTENQLFIMPKESISFKLLDAPDGWNPITKDVYIYGEKEPSWFFEEENLSTFKTVRPSLEPNDNKFYL